MNEGIKKLVTNQLANIIENEDGSKIIEYTGIELGSFLTLGDLQKSVINILSVILKAWNMKDVYNHDTGFETIKIQPYSGYFSNLNNYFEIKK